MLCSILFRYRCRLRSLFLSLGNVKALQESVLERYPWESFCDFFNLLVKVFSQFSGFFLSLFFLLLYCHKLEHREHVLSLLILSQDLSHRLNKCLLHD